MDDTGPFIPSPVVGPDIEAGAPPGSVEMESSPEATTRSQTSDDSGGFSTDCWSTSRGPESPYPTGSGSSASSLSDASERWQAHVTLSDFTTNLESALKGVFPNRNRPRYRRVYVLLMRWEIGDPKLPVVIEMEELRRIFHDIFHFHVEIFEIPEHQSHLKVSQKVNEFIMCNNDDKDDLKIFYYAGHGTQTKSRDLLFSSYRGEVSRRKESTVTWSGIQSTLEQASSDALVILDCCGAGRGNIGDGSGVTELIAACNYDGTANGVGAFSFTNHLNTELRLLARTAKPFTVAELYDHIYNRMQSHMTLGVANERYPGPVHLFLTRDQHFSRSIELAPRAVPPHAGRAGAAGDARNINEPGRPPSKHLASLINDVPPSKRVCRPAPQFTQGRPINRPIGLPSSLRRSQHYEPRVPTERTMLFAVRLDETMTTEKLAVEAFQEWFRKIPALVNDVRCTLEAQFLCDSSLLLITVPISVWTCLKNHPAVMCLGPVKSSNMLSVPAQLGGDQKPVQSQSSLTAKKRVTFADSTQDTTTPSFPSLSDDFDDSRASEPQEPFSDRDIEEDPVPYHYPVLEGPEQPRRNEEPFTFNLSGPALVYVRNISDKYPGAERDLVERLGQANWERHVRIRKALEHTTEQAEPIDTVEPSVFKPASFRDSGLGSSIGQLQAYEPSLATSFASRVVDDADCSHFRVPPMPRHESGVGVQCPYCDRYYPNMNTRREWKRHVFQDIRAYICTRSGCHASLSTFSTRTEWAQHEIQEHFLKESAARAPPSRTSDELAPAMWNSLRNGSPVQSIRQIEEALSNVSCPLCPQTLNGSKEYVSHVGRHLESISLAPIPQGTVDGSDGEGSVPDNERRITPFSGIMNEMPVEHSWAVPEPDNSDDMRNIQDPTWEYESLLDNSTNVAEVNNQASTRGHVEHPTQKVQAKLGKARYNKQQGVVVTNGSSSRETQSLLEVAYVYQWICHRCKSEMSYLNNSRCTNVSCRHTYCERSCELFAIPYERARDQTPEGWRT